MLTQLPSSIWIISLWGLMISSFIRAVFGGFPHSLYVWLVCFFLTLPLFFFFFQFSYRSIDFHREDCGTTERMVPQSPPPRLYMVFFSTLFKSSSLLTSQRCFTLEDFVLETIIEATIHFAMQFGLVWDYNVSMKSESSQRTLPFLLLFSEQQK